MLNFIYQNVVKLIFVDINLVLNCNIAYWLMCAEVWSSNLGAFEGSENRK